MEAVTFTITMPLDEFKQLVREHGFSYEIKYIDEPNYDYSANEKWERQHAIAKSEWRKLKEIEFDLRHNT